jgi:uncharacterized membrane protein YfcA
LVLVPFELFLVFLAFLLGVLDATFGGGYGTILTPALLMVGFDPFKVVPAVLVSQLIGNFLAAFCHHKFKNVDLTIRGKNFRIAVTLAVLSSIGSTVSVIVAFNLSSFYLNLYIGMLVLAMGFMVLAIRKRKLKFSWSRLLFFGSLAAFNKGLSGGGYGPLVAGGQILTGVDAKNAIGITCLAEGITCIIAVISYIALGRNIDYTLSFILSIGVAFSALAAAYIVRKIESKQLKFIWGIVIIILGLSTIFKTLNIFDLF